MLTNINSENNNDCNNTFMENTCKYNNQYKKRRLSHKTPEKNDIVHTSAHPTSSPSPPRSPISIHSFNNIVIKTPNISRILSHLSIRTPKKNINSSNASSPLNLLNALQKAKTEPDPLLSTNELFLQTPQPSQPSSPSLSSIKRDQVQPSTVTTTHFTKESQKNKVSSKPVLRNASTPKSIRSFNLNSTPTKSLKSINFDMAFSPSKESEISFNNYPASPTSSFFMTTPTKGKSRVRGAPFKNQNKNDSQDQEGSHQNQDISWFKTISSNESTSFADVHKDEDIFKYKRMNSISILRSKSNLDYSYRDTDRASLSSITDDTLSTTTTSSSSYNFLSNIKKHQKNKKDSTTNTSTTNPSSFHHTHRQGYGNGNEKLPLSPEPSFLRTNSMYSGSLDKEDPFNKSFMEKNSMGWASSSNSNTNILNTGNGTAESLSSSYASSILKNGNLSFLSTVNHDIFNHYKTDAKMDIVSEIESIADTVPISDISMFMDEEAEGEEVKVEDGPKDHSLSSGTALVESHSKIEEKSASITTDPLSHPSEEGPILPKKEEMLTTPLSKSLSLSMDKGFLNIDGIWEDPSLSQYEARNLKEKEPEMDEIDFEQDPLEKLVHRSQSFPSTPTLKYSNISSFSSTSGRNKINSNGKGDGEKRGENEEEGKGKGKGKKHLRKSSQSLLLNMDGTASPVSLEGPETRKTMNRKTKKQFTALNTLNTATTNTKSPYRVYRRANSVISSSSSTSSFTSLASASTSSTMMINKIFSETSLSGHPLPSWKARRKGLVRSNSVSDMSESLASERKRSFSSLEEDDEYTSDASSIRRSPSSLRKLNAQRKGKEKLVNKILLKNKIKDNHHSKNTDRKEKGQNSSSSSSSTTSLSLDKGKKKVVEDPEEEVAMIQDHLDHTDDDGDIMMNGKEYPTYQDRMSISETTYHPISSASSSASSSSLEKEELVAAVGTRSGSRINYELLDPSVSHQGRNKGEIGEMALVSDTAFTNHEFNEIQQAKKHENKENVHVHCNNRTGDKCEKGGERERAEEAGTEPGSKIQIMEPPPLLEREMIFVDEKGNVYNEQNYKYLSNYTKAVIADELSKRYCRIPLTEILVSNMPEYRQYFDENGQLKPNNFIYVETEEEEEEEYQEAGKDSAAKQGINKVQNSKYHRSGRGGAPHQLSNVTTLYSSDLEEEEAEEKEKEKEEGDKKVKTKEKDVSSLSSNTSQDSSSTLFTPQKPLKTKSNIHGASPISNINLLRNDTTHTTIEFRTEPLSSTTNKEMIFESTLSPKGKPEWQDITETSLRSEDEEDFEEEEEEETNGAYGAYGTSGTNGTKVNGWRKTATLPTSSAMEEDPIQVQDQEPKENKRNSWNKGKEKKKASTKARAMKNEEEDDDEEENEENFVEKIDDKVTIIYRTNESKYQLVIPIKLNIYNKKDTIL